MGRKPIVKRRKRDSEKVLEWAAVLFPHLQQEGVKSLTMDRAATILSKSKSTLYEYLSSKEEIIELIIDYKIKQLNSFKLFLNNSDLDYTERLSGAIACVSTHSTGISNLFLKELRQFYPKQWQKVDQFVQESVDALNEYYKEGTTNGAFKNINANLLTLMDQQFLYTIIDAQNLEKHSLTFDKALSDYLQIKLHGIVP
jgi:AcrR family transcriptional regulator